MTAGFSADMSEALRHFTAVRDAVVDHGPSRVLSDALFGRSSALRELCRLAEAAENAHDSLAVAREIGYPAGEVLALMELSQAAGIADDPGRAVRLARQAEQIMADIPGRIDRACSANLTSVLIAAGDMAAAESVCAAGLARSRGAGSAMNLAQLLMLMVILDLQASRIQDAATHLREALQIVVRTGDRFQLQNGLDCCGHLCAATGRPAEAITMWAAHTALCRDDGFADWPADARRRQKPLREARCALGPARTRVAEDRGAAMSLAAAAEYALMLTDPGPQPAGPAQVKLSSRERELITLVAQGRTNAQIAAQLYISIRTVSSHLDRIRDKTGCRRRADLTRLALGGGLI
jgi:DNA-binding CsgD family transcriptional regulator